MWAWIKAFLALVGERHQAVVADFSPWVAECDWRMGEMFSSRWREEL